jgi:predicted DNA-binding protein
MRSKRNNRVAKSFRLNPETCLELEKLAEMHGFSQADIIDNLVEAAFNDIMFDVSPKKKSYDNLLSEFLHCRKQIAARLK